jgi:excisionase family DNA binding protein
MQVVNVAEAADLLGVSEAQVGRLISRGDISASRWGRSWVIPTVSVHRYLNLRPERGRPFPYVKAWEVLRTTSPSSLEEVRALAISCRRRAERHDARIVAGMLDHVRNDSRIMLSGVDSAKHFGAAVSVQPPLDFYLRKSDVDSFYKDYEPNSSSNEHNCVIRVIEDVSTLDIPSGQYVPLLVALVDLIAEGDYRSAKEAFKSFEVLNGDKSSKSSG